MIYLTQVDSYTTKTTEETTDKYTSPQVTTSPLSIDICLGHTLYKLTILEDPELRLIFKLYKIPPAQVCISKICYFVSISKTWTVTEKIAFKCVNYISMNIDYRYIVNLH